MKFIKTPLTRQKRLILSLLSLNIMFFGLITSLLYSWHWHTLAITTTIFALLFPCIGLSIMAYRFVIQPLQHILWYSQSLNEGEQNQQTNQYPTNDLVSKILTELTQITIEQKLTDKQHDKVQSILSQMLDNWPFPVCLFNPNQELLYANNSAIEHIARPLLIGNTAKSLGFQIQQQRYSHQAFDSNWHCHSIHYQQNNESFHFFTAVYIGAQLGKAASLGQQNIIRVLSHELRNSLTPMASMADTLLCAPAPPEQQIKLVLQRIKNRSERLLSFIEHYVKLSQLPQAQQEWFNLHEIIDECRVLLSPADELNYRGDNQCYADPQLLSQLLINIVKNAKEANASSNINSPTKIDLLYVQQDNKQILQITDNGPGFSNLDNVLTPFYTTKVDGSGIGLALAASIMQQHNGQLTAKNTQQGHAQLIASWPLK